MPDMLVTRPSLLVRLRDPQDGPAWQQFIELYGGLVYGFVRRRGLQDADAADLTQEVLHAVSQSMGKFDYDPAQGTFRGWLFSVTRHKIARYLQKQKRQAVGSGDSAAQRRLDEEADPDDMSEKAWDKEYEQQLFRVAAEQVRGSFTEGTWQAFWQTAVEGKPAPEVAAALGMSVGAVYVAKSRVMARLAEQVQKLQEE